MKFTNPMEPGAADRAMERGAQAYRDGWPNDPPENESLLSRDWWRMGWRHAEEEDVAPEVETFRSFCPSCRADVQIPADKHYPPCPSCGGELPIEAWRELEIYTGPCTAQ